MVFFTSDTHFNHANIIKYCKRPFKNAEQMDNEMIRRWNAVVAPDDIVYHLGDFCFGNAGLWRYYRGKLNGSIHLILGNHDKQVPTGLFASVEHYQEVEVEGRHIVLFHYGMRTWHHDLRETWHLYGHSHGGLPPLGKSMDVGVDAHKFAPVSFNDLSKMMEKRKVAKHPAFNDYHPDSTCDLCGKLRDDCVCTNA